MDEYLSSDITWRGRFWLPDSPDDVQRGTLTYTPDGGVRLALIGGFDDAIWQATGDGRTSVLSALTRRWPMIHGTVGNKPVTLLDCAAVSSKSSLFATEVSEQELRVAKALIGVFMKEPEGELFSEIRVEIENLSEWDYRPDIVLQIEYPEAAPRKTRWDIKVDPVKPRRVQVGDLTVELHRWYRLPSHDVRRGRLEVRTFAVSYFTVRSTQPKSVSGWIETAHVLQDLITLAMDSPSALLTEKVKPSESLRADEASQARDDVAVYAQHTVTAEPDAKGVQGTCAIFTLGVEGVSYDQVIPKWFSVRRRFDVACDMILGLLYVSDGYVQPQLITAVAAAEAFHEALGLDPPVSDAEVKALKKLLKEAIPKERHQWLSEKIGRNGHTLRQRLAYLASRPDDGVMRLLLPNADGWVDAAKNARNLVAHGGETGSDVLLMYAITEVTTAVVIVNLMHELGVPAERLIEMIQTAGRLERAARLAREHWPVAGEG